MRHGLVVALISAVILIPAILAPMNLYDGGLVGSAGTFVAHGEIPYRDFWWLYGPLAPIVSAILTSLFGPSVLLLRLAGMATIAAGAGLGYQLLRPSTPHVAAAMFALAGAGAASSVLGIDLTAWSLATALALAGLLLARSNRPVFAGVVLGLTFLARLDVGAYALLAAVAILPRRRLLAGFAVVALPFAAFDLYSTPLADLIQELIWYPLFGVRIFRYVPPPGFDDLFTFLLFLSVVLGPKLAIGATAIRLLASRERDRGLIALVVFAALCQFQTVGRGDIHHQASAAPVGLLLFATLGAPRLQRLGTPQARAQASLRLVTFAMSSVVAASAIFVGVLNLAIARTGPPTTTDVDMIAGIRTLIANTRKNEPVFVGLTNHRFTDLNAMLAYYLADRVAGTWGTMFNPGITNTEQVQARIVRELTASKTSILMLDDHNANKFEPTNESAIPGSTTLDQFIAANYVRVCQFGSISILARVDRDGSISCISPRSDESFGQAIVGLGP